MEAERGAARKAGVAGRQGEIQLHADWQRPAKRTRVPILFHCSNWRT
jgi:hypothetical protein